MKNIKCYHCHEVTSLDSVQPGVTVACEHCGKTLVQYPSTAKVEQNQKCAFCGTSINDEEISAICPSCGIEYHDECWEENKGCATYGCEYTGCLDTVKPSAKTSGAPLPPSPLPEGDYTTVPRLSKTKDAPDQQKKRQRNILFLQGALMGGGWCVAALCCVWSVGVLLDYVGWFLQRTGKGFRSFELYNAYFGLLCVTVMIITGYYLIKFQGDVEKMLLSLKERWVVIVCLTTVLLVILALCQ